MITVHANLSIHHGDYPYFVCGCHVVGAEKENRKHAFEVTDEDPVRAIQLFYERLEAKFGAGADLHLIINQPVSPSNSTGPNGEGVPAWKKP